VLGRPHVRAARLGIVPPGERFGERPVEDLAEIPGLGERLVLDQAEKVRSRRGQGPAGVVLGEAVEFLEDHLADLSQVAVQILLREIIDHAT
jgi:hypothetical protein